MIRKETSTHWMHISSRVLRCFRINTQATKGSSHGAGDKEDLTLGARHVTGSHTKTT